MHSPEFEHRIITKAHSYTVVEWCQQNVGRLLWSNPVVEWHGEGWHVKSIGYPDRIYRRATFRDPELATLAGLALAGET